MLETEMQSEICERCWKDKRLCVCESIHPVENKFEVLVLQHPREAANPWGTARLLSLGLKKSTHRIGLSWKSLSDALGVPKEGPKPDPKQWSVLFLGTRADAKKAKSTPHSGPTKGMIILDGNWKQSKTLWWRNPWLLKVNRIVIESKEIKASKYGEYRRQPRKGCLSSIEAAGECLTQLGEPETVSQHLHGILELFLHRVDEVT
jgi:DTW domain-containing protein